MIDTDNLIAYIEQNTRSAPGTAYSPICTPGNTMPTKSNSQPGDEVLIKLGFVRLSEGASLYTPPSIPRPSSSTDPTLLILCSWAFAQPRHIAKYLTPYQSLYPHTTILLIQNAIRNMIWLPNTWQYSFFEPAALAIQSHLNTTSNPHILLHLFSNGGGHAAVQLSEIYRTTCGGARLPIDAMILDSAPGIPRFIATVNAMVQGVPGANPVVRGTVAALSWAMVTSTAVCEVLGIAEPAGRKLYRKLYDPYDVFVFQGSPKAEKERRVVPRSYVFSKEDTMIFKEDIAANAEHVCEELRRAGVTEKEIMELVRMEEFVGTAHVNHVKGGMERYWDIVKNTWERSLRP